MSFLNMWSELVGTIPELTSFLAQNYIKRAWTDVAKTRSWSWKQQDAFLNSPVAITAGVVAVEQFSDVVTASGDSKTALDAAEAAGDPPLVGRQFRQGFRGAVYTITAYDNATGDITLDQPFQSATDPTSTYTVYQCLYEIPGVKVQRVISVIDPNNGYAFTKLHVPRQTIDRMDPTRSSQQLPFWLVDYDALGAKRNVRYELWPHPITAQTFQLAVRILETTLEDDDDELPEIVPEGLVISKAFKDYAIPWAITNASRFPRIKGINFAVLYKIHSDNYRDALADAKKDDDGRMLNSKVTRRWGLRRFPLDANFMQNHDVNRLG